ncbi:cell division protein [Pantoea agglomerans]|uniref:Cell division protein n=1 Tax=Enterobacter agglomerans TaxID=549 RepID=A0A379AMV0_ENTAG|nr:cell division protein [Pantoea agglomerans]
MVLICWPHGVLSHQHALTIARQNEAIAAPLLQALPDLRARYQWIIFDLPADTLPWHETLYPTLDSLLCVTQPDANCHLRLSQRQFPARTPVYYQSVLMPTAVCSRICISSGWPR